MASFSLSVRVRRPYKWTALLKTLSLKLVICIIASICQTESDACNSIKGLFYQGIFCLCNAQLKAFFKSLPRVL